MLKYNRLSAAWLIAAALAVPSIASQTWHLSSQKGWESISDNPEGNFAGHFEDQTAIDSGGSQHATG